MISWKLKNICKIEKETRFVLFYVVIVVSINKEKEKRKKIWNKMRTENLEHEIKSHYFL